MRGFFIAVLVLAGLVTLALWGVISYRNHLSYNNGMVDSRATRVIKVDVGSLTRDIGWNAFWNPAYYAGEESNEFMEKKKMMKTGVGAAAKVFLFQVGDKPFWANATFGLVPLADATVFTDFLQTELGMQVGQDSVGRYGRREHVVVRYDERQAAVALGNFAQGHGSGTVADSLLMAQLGAYLAGEQLVSIKESRFFEAMGQSGHIVSAGSERMSVDFREGEIVFSYALDHAAPEAASSPPLHWSDSSLVRLRGGLMGLLPAGSVFSVGEFALHSDSLRQLAVGDVVGEWRGMATQTDSVVAWSYDENFEMQEVVERVERPTPDLYLSVQAKADGLQRYLLREGMLDSVSFELNPAFFPLFRVFWQQDEDWLTLYTQRLPAEAGSPDDGPPLYLAADIQAIKQYATLAKIQSCLAPFRALTLASDEESQGTTLRGRITMEESTVNSLMQLLVRNPNAS